MGADSLDRRPPDGHLDPCATRNACHGGTRWHRLTRPQGKLLSDQMHALSAVPNCATFTQWIVPQWHALARRGDEPRRRSALPTDRRFFVPVPVANQIRTY